MKRSLLLGLALAGTVVLAACAAGPTPTEKPAAPTAATAPTATAVPIAAAPTATQAPPTATAKPAVASCITCHTNKATLETLAIKKAEKSAETEGEG